MIEIDGKRLTWQEFGELVSCHEGRGMRIAFVPDDELNTTPCIDLAPTLTAANKVAASNKCRCAWGGMKDK